MSKNMPCFKKIISLLLLSSVIASCSACVGDGGANVGGNDSSKALTSENVQNESTEDNQNTIGSLEYNDNRADLFKYGLLMVQKGDKYIYVDKNNVALDFECPATKLETEGKASYFIGVERAIVQGNSNDYIIDTKGNRIGDITFDFKGKRISKNGLAAFKSTDKKYGFINTLDGSIAIEALFEDVEDFGNCGLAPAKKDGKWGYINANGEFVIEPKYDGAKSFYECDLAFVTINGYYEMINPTGKVLVSEIERTLDPMENCKLVALNKNGLWGCVNYNGEVIIDFKYTFGLRFDNYSEYHSGDVYYAMMETEDDKKGLIDSTGKVIIPPEYEYVTEFSTAGIAVAYGTINKHQHIARFYDKSGNVTFENMTFEIGQFGDCGLAPFKGWKEGYVNTKGEIVIPLQYKQATHFHRGGYALVKTMDGDFAIIDTKGNIVEKNQKYNDVYGYSNNTFCYGFDDNYTLIDSNQKVLLTGMDAMPTEFSRDGYAIISMNGKKGVIDKNYNIVIPCEYDDIKTNDFEGRAWTEGYYSIDIS